MSSKSYIPAASPAGDEAISFILKFASSQQFDRVFREGMGLVERTAAYLDGEGRREAKALPGQLGVIYATESMRLTTRLLEIASWLLVQRALKEGDISVQEAAAKRDRVKLRPFGRPAHISRFAELPETFRSLIEDSFALNDRITHLDQQLYTTDVPKPGGDAAANPVGDQLQRLFEAFGVQPGNSH